jgi:hypothetical protein
MQRATSKISKKVCGRRRGIQLGESSEFVQYPCQCEVIHVMPRSLTIFRWLLPISTKSPIDDFRVNLMDLSWGKTEFLHGPRSVGL